MRVKNLILIPLVFSGICINHNYNLFTGRTFFSKRGLERVFTHRPLEKLEVGSHYQIRGIYSEQSVSFYDEGLWCVPLVRRLRVKEGTLIEVRGEITGCEVPYKTLKKTQIYKCLNPISYRIIFDTEKLKAKVQKEYRKIKESLQSKITLRYSQLQLPPDPKWTVIWCRDSGDFVISARTSDLMYAAEVDFVFDGERKQLKEVYASEWFKGER